MRLIIGEVLKVLPDHIHQQNMHMTLSVPQMTEIDNKLGRLALGEPITRILGRREFWKHTFILGEETLDPRPESEHLVEEVLDFYSTSPVPKPRILDMGTGSGCLLLSLLDEIPEATGVGVDISYGALLVARENARRLNLAKRCMFVQGNWGKELCGGFDIIVSNPPYISDSDFMGLDDNVCNYDPYRALVSGEDGLECYRMIHNSLPFLAKKKSFVAMEIGCAQKKAVQKLFFNMLCGVACVRDLAGKDRIIKGFYDQSI
ncbi:MAG: peptide chain release factor N(5)-glutamine methyltransferase [Alphaproteobacteria bacterium]|nr:MAG: peptide chain release factor N(5)-glutamine methyltransferase [Alphaproteobacteria bacterium]